MPDLMKTTLARPKLMRALLAAVVVLMAVTLYALDLPRISLSVELRSTTTGKGEIFFAAPGTGYAQERSRPFLVTADDQWHVYEIPLPREQPIERIRVDLVPTPGKVSVRSIEVREGDHRLEFDGHRLRDAHGATHHIRVEPGKGQVFDIAPTGRDPWFEVKLPRPVGGRSLPVRLLGLVAIAALSFLAWQLLELALAGIRRHASMPHKIGRIIDRISGFASDERVLRVDRRIVLVFAGIGLLATLYVAMQLNQSSIGIWESIYPRQPVEQMVDIGTPKLIRVDEWRVQTPWVLNQVLRGSPMHNQNVGAESSPLIASLPVDSVLGLPNLKFTGFLLFDIDRGVSWWWAYKSFALMFCFLWLNLLLTRGNLTASLLGTAWIYFSSFIQWWFSSNLPEIMIAFAAGVIGAIYALFSARRGLIAMGCVLMFFAAANVALNLYPPFVVPLAYLGVAILVGYGLRYASFSQWRDRIGFRAVSILLAAAAIAAYAVAYVTAAADSIEAMLGTVYPGQRVAESGGVPLAKVVYGFFEVFRLGEQHFPFPPTNASEASSFVLLSPLMLLVIPWRSWFRRESALLATLACFCLVASVWIVMVDAPAHLERLMQLAGWSLVTPKRAVMALGVGSILGCTVLFARMQAGSGAIHREDVRRMSVVVVLVGVVTLGWGLSQIDPGFFSWKVIGIGALAGSLAAAGLALGRTSLLAAGLAIFALPILSINPLVSGISAITEKPILLAAKNQSSATESKWVVIGDSTFTQGLKAHGLSVFAGTQYLPDRKSLSILDPNSEYERIWNRYATVRVISDPSKDKPSFRQTRGDQYFIALRVCGGWLARLGITHVAYTIPVPAEDLACLQALPAPTDSGVKLFKLRATPQGTGPGETR